jgi:hypothetical protein
MHSFIPPVFITGRGNEIAVCDDREFSEDNSATYSDVSLQTVPRQVNRYCF